MEFVVSKREFMKALGRVQSVADKRSAMPVLTNMLIASEGSSSLRLAATDLLISITSHTAAEVRKGGSVALPARSLYEMVKNLPEGEVHVTIAPNYSARVSGGRRRYDLVGMPGEDFPALPSPGQTELRDIPADALSELVGYTSFSMSTDDTRPHLAGALFEADANILRMVTTDGHRLSKAEKQMTEQGAKLSILIPQKGINEIKRLLDEIKSEKSPDGLGVVSLGRAGSNLFVKRDETVVAVKLIDATFPPYAQVIPAASERKARVNRAEMLSAMRAVSVVASDRSSGVKLQFSRSKLIISSENPDLGAGTDEMAIELTGSDLTVGFNSKYVMDVLSALSCEDVIVELSGELDPGVLRIPDSDEFVGVVMPMRI
ncbi:MAG: DNA polymerase III subunit beta [Deltaproteobacteria bacterium]|nr:DNA polymerase III subunit beta [Deltaproteobacteria bacterium]